MGYFHTSLDSGGHVQSKLNKKTNAIIHYGTSNKSQIP